MSVRYLSKAEQQMYGGQNGSSKDSISISECGHYMIFDRFFEIFDNF